MGKPIGKSHLQKIIPVRVSAEDWEQLRKQAQGMGIGVSTLTRIWVMGKLGNTEEGNLSKQEHKDGQQITHHRRISRKLEV